MGDTTADSTMDTATSSDTATPADTTTPTDTDDADDSAEPADNMHKHNGYYHSHEYDQQAHPYD